MLQKQGIAINFSKGLDTKTDPYQVMLGNFLSLENSVFTKGGLLQKRNGYQSLQSLPDNSSSYLTTFNGSLTALGENISSYSSGSKQWFTKGTTQPLNLSTLPMIRNNLNQTQCDAVIASNGLVCVVYSETNGSALDYKYVIADSTTGQNIISPTLIPVTTGTVTGSPRVFLLGNFFVIVFTNVIGATPHLQYVSVSTLNPSIVTTNTDIAASYVSSPRLSWDGVVVGSKLFLAYDTTTGGQSVSVTYLTSSQAAKAFPPASATKFSGQIATIMSLTADVSNASVPIIYVTYYSSSSSTGYTAAVDQSLNVILAPTEVITSGTVLNLATAAQNKVVTIYSEISNSYSYDSSIPTNYINMVTCTQAGIVGSSSTVIRSLGLASKAFILNGSIYFLAAYQSAFQPTYFLINGSLSKQASPVIIAKLAYENGGGYLPTGLPGFTISGNSVSIPYLYKDLIEAINTLNNPQQTTAGGIYSQTGVNLATFTIGTQGIDSAEAGSNLLLSGGFLWSYDGYLPVEQNFFVWPDNVEVSASATVGNMTAQQYYYQVIYEWSDNQGNIYRSAPSIPVTITLTSSTSVAVNVPTLRLTYKTANPVKISIYRWSQANQIYYEVTSITQPLMNSTTIDSVTFTDTLADSSIIGNNIIYTTGGVIEDVNGPASNIMTLFDTRLWLVDAEDPNLLWYSKQVIEATPVEMSDLLTYYIAPNTGTSNSTGPITALAPMDDKLIIFKKDAIYYINGTGPDNTGANSQYSQPIFVASTVGCSNQNSVVLMPQGLMFQSDKGIWLLGRDLSTNYIGAAVEQYNSSTVQSAVGVPETNQDRFTLSTGETLMYDYFYGQWGTFKGVPAISSCIYDGLHTYLNAEGQVFQESPGTYLDGSNPVLMSFTTSWINLAGLQGFQRAYYFYMLGTYMSPHLVNFQIAYDYNPSPSQNILIHPTNFSPNFGATTMPVFGQQSIYGGPGNIEQWRIFLDQQKCQAFQIQFSEVYDPSYGIPASAGLTVSGLNLIVGLKKKYVPVAASQSSGGSK